MFNHNAYNLLLFYRKIEIWVELIIGYDKSKANFLFIFRGMLSSAHVLAMDAKHLLDVIDKIRMTYPHVNDHILNRGSSASSSSSSGTGSGGTGNGRFSSYTSSSQSMSDNGGGSSL